MVEFLKSQEISFDYYVEDAKFKLPPLKKKIFKKMEAPNVSNVDVPMSEKEISQQKNRI